MKLTRTTAGADLLCRTCDRVIPESEPCVMIDRHVDKETERFVVCDNCGEDIARDDCPTSMLRSMEASHRIASRVVTEVLHDQLEYSTIVIQKMEKALQAWVRAAETDPFATVGMLMEHNRPGELTREALKGGEPS